MSRLPWDSWSSSKRPLCITIDQLNEFDVEYTRLAEALESDLIKTTGCIRPCRYKEFRTLGKPNYINFIIDGFQLGFAKLEVVEEKEAFVYDFISFVSEFGGALGLFLGFSFLSIWDLFEPLLSAFYIKQKKMFFCR